MKPDCFGHYAPLDASTCGTCGYRFRCAKVTELPGPFSVAVYPKIPTEREVVMRLPVMAVTLEDAAEALAAQGFDVNRGWVTNKARRRIVGIEVSGPIYVIRTDLPTYVVRSLRGADACSVSRGVRKKIAGDSPSTAKWRHFGSVIHCLSVDAVCSIVSSISVYQGAARGRPS